MGFDAFSQYCRDVFFLPCVFVKGSFHGRQKEGSDGLLVAESHLRFAGVHIDIDLAVGQLEKGDEERETSCRNRIAIGDAHNACKRSILYRATVDEQELFGSAVRMMRRKGAERLQTHALLLRC